ncbi:MAG: glycosyltransferase [Gemmatimonadota bacterium]
MVRIRKLDPGPRLADYTAVSHLQAAAAALQSEAEATVSALQGGTVWMLNSTAAGGGVAELLPTQIALLCDLGVDARWIVLETELPEFFVFTKQLHNLIHGGAEPHPTARDRELYERVSRENCAALQSMIKPDDILIVHDPQPLAVGSMLVQEGFRGTTIWRCHIGLDEETEHTRAAWDFLQPYTKPYQRAVFSLADYVPEFLRDRATIIHPTIDPLSHKNRDLSLHKQVGILCDSGLAVGHWPVLDPPFEHRAQRLQADGSFGPATEPDDIGLLARPIITQVSRWDRLKGFGPLLEAFARLKLNRGQWKVVDERHGRRVDLARLVLAGPAVDSIQDDPEALSVLAEIRAQYLSLDESVQRDVAVIALPMQSRKENAIMVNALQRCSDIVVQNSLREGFGLTVAEAMWKRVPILGSARAAGVRLQVRDGIDGRLAEDPEDTTSVARLVHDMLSDSDRLDEWGRNAQLRVHAEFLVFSGLKQWLQLLSEVATTGNRDGTGNEQSRAR